MGADKPKQWAAVSRIQRLVVRVDVSGWRMARDAHSDGSKIDEIEGEAQKVGFGEHAKKTYVEVMEMNPKYAEYLMAEGHRGNIEVKKFHKWIIRGGSR